MTDSKKAILKPFIVPPAKLWLAKKNLSLEDKEYLDLIRDIDLNRPITINDVINQWIHKDKFNLIEIAHGLGLNLKIAMPALSIAAELGQNKTFKYLIDNGAKISNKDKVFNSIVRTSNVELLDYLFKNQTDSVKNILMHLINEACQYKQMQILKYIESSSLVELRPEHWQQAFTYRVWEKDTLMAEYIAKRMGYVERDNLEVGLITQALILDSSALYYLLKYSGATLDNFLEYIGPNTKEAIKANSERRILNDILDIQEIKEVKNPTPIPNQIKI